jgi:hypothetical protein
MDCRVKPGNDEGFACLMACKKYGCRLLTGLPNPAVIIVTNDGTTTRERDRAELVLDYTLGSGLRSHYTLILLHFLEFIVSYPLAYPQE